MSANCRYFRFSPISRQQRRCLTYTFGPQVDLSRGPLRTAWGWTFPAPARLRFREPRSGEGRRTYEGAPRVNYLETRSFEIDVPIWVNAVSISLGLLSMKKLAGPLAHVGSTGDTPVPSSS